MLMEWERGKDRKNNIYLSSVQKLLPLDNVTSETGWLYIFLL